MSQHTSSSDLTSRISAFMSAYAKANLYVQGDLDELLQMINESQDQKELESLGLRLFNSEWISMPFELSIPLLRRLIILSSDSGGSKLLLGKWLLLFGMEYENDEEGIQLLSASQEGRKIVQ